MSTGFYGTTYTDPQEVAHRNGMNEAFAPVCGEPYPKAPEYVCSKAKKHRGNHSAYRNHENYHRSALLYTWVAGMVGEDDVQAAIASIMGEVRPATSQTSPAKPDRQTLGMAGRTGNEAVDHYVLRDHEMFEVLEDGSLSPHGILTRVELVEMLNRAKADQARTEERNIDLQTENLRLRQLVAKIRSTVEELTDG